MVNEDNAIQNRIVRAYDGTTSMVEADNSHNMLDKSARQDKGRTRGRRGVPNGGHQFFAFPLQPCRWQRAAI